MATTAVENVTAKAEALVLQKATAIGEVAKENVGCENGTKVAEEQTATAELAKEKMNCENGTKVAEAEELSDERVQEDKEKTGNEVRKEEAKEDIAVEVEPKTGVSFPVKLNDGKQLNCVGLRKKSMLGLGIKIYGFDNEKLKELLRSKIGKSPAKATKEMYQTVIDSDVGMTVRIVIVFSNLTMSMVKKNFDEGLGASIKKLTGGKKNDELANKVMGHASEDIKLTSGSVIEISRLPGYTLQARVMDQVVSNVESELLCKAYIHMYLGDDAFDKDAKEKLGMSLLSLF
ncbi:Chalcone isomerase domain-containing protein [Citrus sinensis]|uniref:Chalcone isomerase domain-containing protein n=1 Tax=Citrus sinensis TaxID=2711 RepID=A0ACB8N013_CITSI|nr:Chalcone isomerase domain-containing protein [Citrus sinensis]